MQRGRSSPRWYNLQHFLPCPCANNGLNRYWIPGCNDFVAEVFWPTTAGHIYEIGLGNLAQPLSLFFDSVADELGDSKDQQEEQNKEGETILIQTVWRIFKEFACKNEFGDLCKVIFSDRRPLSTNSSRKVSLFCKGIGFFCKNFV
ncbi:hypothetical protein SUGI_0195070 [Cryptomeria japonica]|nr:hypothetical protein SUGI_0195070 [Cryptomeria japonica]